MVFKYLYHSNLYSIYVVEQNLGHLLDHLNVIWTKFINSEKILKLYYVELQILTKSHITFIAFAFC